MKIVFIRHGESEANINHVISNTGYKYGLTENGELQVNLFAQKLKRRYPEPDLMISSPLMRADETARIIGKYYNLEHSTDKRLIEVHTGNLEERSDTESWNKLFDIWNKWINGEEKSEKFEGGECLNDIVKRVKDFLKDLIHNRNEEETIFCISHGCVLKTGLSYISDISNIEELKLYDLKNTDIIEIEYNDRNGLICNGYGSI